MELTGKHNDVDKIALLQTFSSRPLISLEDNKRYFTGFGEEIKKILLAIRTFENALIIGDRGSGKSSLVNQIFYQLKTNQEIIPVKINALRLNPFNQQMFISSMLNEITNSVNQNQTNATKFKKILVKMAKTGVLGIPTVATGFSFSPNESIDILVERLQIFVKQLKKNDLNVCILLDDADKLDPQIIWQTLRGIRDMLWELRISIIITSLPDQVSKITKAPLDHFFPYWIKLKQFNYIQTKKFIKKRVDDAKISLKITDDAIEKIIKKTKGNPQSIVELLKNIIENKKDLSEPITSEQVDNIGLPYSASLSDTERAVFNYLIHNPNTSASSTDFTTKLAVSRSRLAQILNYLKSQNLIGSKKDGKKVVYNITAKGILKHKKIELNKTND